MEEDGLGQRPTTLLDPRMAPASGDSDPWMMGGQEDAGDATAHQDEIPKELLPKRLGIDLHDGKGLVTSWSDPRLEWLGDNLFQVLKASFTGDHLTYMLRNLAPVTPAAAPGFEAWFSVTRDVKGNTGPRLMKLLL